MHILCVHNQFQQYGGSDGVAQADERLLAEHGPVLSYTRHSGEIDSAGRWERVTLGVDALYSRRTVREITELARHFRPDVAYVHNVFPLISPSLYHVLHQLGIPSVHIIHDFRLWCANSRFYINNQICESCKLGNYWGAVRKRCFRDSAAYSGLYAASLYLNRRLGLMGKIGGYICLTEFARSLLLESGIPEDRIYICPNHLDTSAYAPQFGKGQYVLYLGGLYRDKGVLTVAAAFKQLPHVPLKIVGSGDAEGELREYIHRNGLSNIELVGFKNGQEKKDYLRNSLFTIVASHCYENFPIVVLEAFASGKPVVASNIGALPHIIRHQQTGLLVEAQNVGDLAASVRWLYEHPVEIATMGRQARAVAEHQYDLRFRYSSLETIFKQVIEKSRATRRHDGSANHIAVRSSSKCAEAFVNEQLHTD
ncbi:MAG: glycosyl transferase group 1 [Acidobacteriaceae bacterium]|nr:glycosyl transferase group 1 [Acidobacteriaceae bacterium]